MVRAPVQQEHKKRLVSAKNRDGSSLHMQACTSLEYSLYTCKIFWLSFFKIAYFASCACWQMMGLACLLGLDSSG